MLSLIQEGLLPLPLPPPLGSKTWCRARFSPPRAPPEVFNASQDAPKRRPRAISEGPGAHPDGPQRQHGTRRFCKHAPICFRRLPEAPKTLPGPPQTPADVENCTFYVGETYTSHFRAKRVPNRPRRQKTAPEAGKSLPRSPRRAPDRAGTRPRGAQERPRKN